MNSDAGAPIYLDYNATTPIAADVLEVMLPYLREHYGNPSSSHYYGQKAQQAIDVARQQVAELLGADAVEIFFTSGGTESNNLAIRGVAEALGGPGHIVTSVIEHPATANPCRYLVEQGWRATWLGVDETCTVKVDQFDALGISDVDIVSVMHANNEVGTLQPIAELADRAHQHGALVHTDAAQSIGKVACKVDTLGVDLLSVAGHKLYAPKGVGALYVRRGTPLRPFVRGAGHEQGYRPGTENVASIVGLGAASQLASQRLENDQRRLLELRDSLWAQLSQAIPGMAINGHPSERLPNTLNVSFAGIRGSLILQGAPEVAASTGSACHEGGEAPSQVLTVMGQTPERALSAVRLSLGRDTQQADIDAAASALIRSYNEQKRRH